uniref:Uncharacterized protein n=3 Tax=Clastoptera arizonana TaxID=38151 RepID=A0A1B6CB52_9HEMI
MDLDFDESWDDMVVLDEWNDNEDEQPENTSSQIDEVDKNIISVKNDKNKLDEHVSKTDSSKLCIKDNIQNKNKECIENDTKFKEIIEKSKESHKSKEEIIIIENNKLDVKEDVQNIDKRHKENVSSTNSSDNHTDEKLSSVIDADKSLKPFGKLEKQKKDTLNPDKVDKSRRVEGGQTNHHTILKDEKVSNVTLERSKEKKGLLEKRNICYIEEKLDSIKTPLIGVEYILEIVPSSPLSSVKYYCLLCDIGGSDKMIISHLKNQSHSTNYLNMFFHSVTKKLNQYLKIGKRHDFFDKLTKHVVAKIEHVFGRLKPTQIDAIDFQGTDIHDKINNSKHLRETKDLNFVNCVDTKHLEDGVCEVGWTGKFATNDFHEIPQSKADSHPINISGHDSPKSISVKSHNDRNQESGLVPKSVKEADKKEKSKNITFEELGYSGRCFEERRFLQSANSSDLSKYEKQIDAIKTNLIKDFKIYEANPESHPQYNKQRNEYYNSLKGRPEKSNGWSDWWLSWIKSLFVEIFNQEKKKVLRQFDLNSKVKNNDPRESNFRIKKVQNRSSKPHPLVVTTLRQLLNLKNILSPFQKQLNYLHEAASEMEMKYKNGSLKILDINENNLVLQDVKSYLEKQLDLNLPEDVLDGIKAGIQGIGDLLQSVSSLEKSSSHQCPAPDKPASPVYRKHVFIRDVGDIDSTPNNFKVSDIKKWIEKLRLFSNETIGISKRNTLIERIATELFLFGFTEITKESLVQLCENIEKHIDFNDNKHLFEEMSSSLINSSIKTAIKIVFGDNQVNCRENCSPEPKPPGASSPVNLHQYKRQHRSRSPTRYKKRSRSKSPLDVDFKQSTRPSHKSAVRKRKSLSISLSPEPISPENIQWHNHDFLPQTHTGHYNKHSRSKSPFMDNFDIPTKKNLPYSDDFDFIGLPYKFLVKRHSAIGSSVGSVAISSLYYSVFNFSLLQKEVPFKIEKTTGSIYVADNLKKFGNDMFSFEVIVSNFNGLKKTTNVTISIEGPPFHSNGPTSSEIPDLQCNNLPINMPEQPPVPLLPQHMYQKPSSLLIQKFQQGFQDPVNNIQSQSSAIQGKPIQDGVLFQSQNNLKVIKPIQVYNNLKEVKRINCEETRVKKTPETDIIDLASEDEKNIAVIDETARRIVRDDLINGFDEEERMFYEKIWFKSDGNLLKDYQEEAKAIELKFVDDICFYKKNPTKHPEYQSCLKDFWKLKGLKPLTEYEGIMKNEFTPFWNLALINLYKKELKGKKAELQQKFLNKCNSSDKMQKSLGDSYGKRQISEVDSWNKRQRSESDLYDKRQKSQGNSSYNSGSSFKRTNLYNRIDDTKPKYDTSVISVLRYISVLEKPLDSLGPKVLNLLSEALSLEKKCGYLDTQFFVAQHYVLFETIKEKLVGLKEANVIEHSLKNIVDNAIEKINYLLVKVKPIPTTNYLQPAKKLSLLEVPKFICNHSKLNYLTQNQKELVCQGVNESLSFVNITEISENDLWVLVETIVSKLNFTSHSSYNFQNKPNRMNDSNFQRFCNVPFK